MEYNSEQLLAYTGSGSLWGSDYTEENKNWSINKVSEDGNLSYRSLFNFFRELLQFFDVISYN